VDKRSFLKKAAVGAGAGAAILGAPAVIGQSPAVRWRLTSGFPKALDTLYGISEVFAKQVGAMTGVKVQISTHASGELVPTPGVVDAVQNGTVEMAHTASYYYFGKDDTFALDCSIPFMLNARQMNGWLYEGNGVKLLREFFAGYNIYNIPGGNTGAQMGGWFRKEIKSAADFKGLKFRVGGFAGKVVERMGGVPQNIPGGDIYPALEKGTIDAAEWVGPYDDEKLGLNKVAAYYAYPGWWDGGPGLSFYVNTKAWEALTPEYKAIVENACAHAGVDMVAKYDARNPAALKRLVATGGAKLFPFTKDVMDSALKNSLELYSDLSAKNPKWKKIYEDLAKFRADANLWFQFSESAFDRFMQSQKW
jgi:TRAP-type mannitol/chloroaromatic compound transport system substrate-binding protein